MLRAMAFIKSAHTLTFFLLSACMGIVLYSAITGQITSLTGIAYVMLLTEGVVLLINEWRCPLKVYAERLGALHGSVADIFLPKWFANRLLPIGGGSFVFSTILLVVRWLV